MLHLKEGLKEDVLLAKEEVHPDITPYLKLE